MKIKNSIKKVSAVAGSALMVGLTMGSAATLADFPQPFVEDDGTVASQIVVGSDGKVADVVGAVNIAASAGQAAVQTEERTAGGSTSPGWSANNGATLSTEKTNLHFQDSFTDSGLKTTMTEDDMSLLESGTVENVDGTDHDYDQYIEVSGQSTSLGSHSDLDDDQLMVDLSSGQLYTAITTFEQGLNVTDAADDNAEIELFGKDFTISGDSDLSQSGETLVLFGGQETTSVGEDSSTTVTVDGNEIDLYVDSVTNNNNANVEIDGSLKDGVQEGDTFSVSGIDEEVRVDDIVYRGELDYGQRGTVVFSIGSEKLTLTHGDAVQVGSDDEDVDGTEVIINGEDSTSSIDGDELSKLEIRVTPSNNDVEYLQVGDQYEDPVFDTFSFAFGGMSPDTEADSRSEITAGISGDDVGTLTLTDDNDNSATVNVEYNEAGSGSVYDSTDGDYDWNFVEGATMGEDTYFAVDSGDFTHLLNVRDIEGHDAGDEITFRDVFSGTDYTATLDSNGGSDEIYIDGQQYHVNSDGSDIQVMWGSNAGSGTTGDAISVFPTMEDENGAMVTPITNAAVGETVDAQADGSGNANMESFELPTGTLDVRAYDSDLSTASGSEEFDYRIDDGSWQTLSDGANVIEVGEVDYVVTTTTTSDSSGGSSGDVTIDNIGLDDDQSDTDGSAKTDPAGLVIEEEDDDNVHNAHVLEWSNDGGEIQVDSPTYTDDSKDESGSLDNDDSITLTHYGTYTVEDDDSESVDLFYPDNQATIGAGIVGGNGELTTSGGGESVSYEAVTGMGSLPNMARLDSEVTETTKSENHLILVGGPAVNTLVSDLVDSGDVDMSQLEGQSSGALLQTVDDAFANGQDAMVVAGVAGSDTREAARYISNYDAHSEALEDAGSSMVLTEAQYMSEN